MPSALTDCRAVWRHLRRSPGFVLVSAFSLGLGLSGGTLGFGILHDVNLRPLPYWEPGRLVRIYEFMEARCAPECLDLVTRERTRDWEQGLKTIASLAIARVSEVEDSGSILRIAATSGNFFSTLGVSAALGRTLLPEDVEQPTGRPILLSDRLWARIFGRDRAVLGASVRLGGTDYSVVGVMPRGMDYPEGTGAWVPLEAGRLADTLPFYHVATRLRHGATVAQLEAELKRFAAPMVARGAPARVATAQPMRRQEPGLLLLFGVVAIGLLIACVNVANLLLVRSVRRSREFAVREALGASRWELARLPLLEGLMVSLAGGLLGLILALLGRSVMPELVSRRLGITMDVHIQWWVFAAGILAAGVLGIVVSVLPALHLRSGTLGRALQEHGTALTLSVRQRRLIRAFVTLEVVLALILTATASEFSRAFLRIQTYSLGFDPDRLLLGRFRFAPDSGLLAAQVMHREATELEQRLRREAGAASAVVWGMTFPRARGGSFDERVALESGPTGWSIQAVPTASYGIQPGFFGAMGIQLIRGRVFTTQDDERAERVIVVTEEVAKLYWPGADPIGKRLRVGRPAASAPWLTVVGVVNGIASLGPESIFGDLGNDRMPFVFQPLGQVETPRVWGVALRAHNDPGSLVPALRRIIAEQGPRGRISLESVGDLSTMRSYGPLAAITLNAGLLSAFAVFGLGLALLGIFGVVAESVDRRRREIAIRSALGAQAKHILGLVLREGLAMTLAGVIAGAIAATFLREILRSQLIGVEPLTLGFLAAVAAGLLLVTVSASLLAARKSLYIAPTIALRDE